MDEKYTNSIIMLCIVLGIANARSIFEGNAEQKLKVITDLITRFLDEQ